MGQSFPLNGVSVGAGATVSVLVGSTIEYQNKASVLTIYDNGDAVGLQQTFFMNDGSTTITIIPPGSGVGVASTVGKTKTNEDFVIQYAIPAGEHLVHQITNPTAGTVDFNALYVIT
jgi:hypothetical protein